jgi:hypothetical protein
MLRGRGLIEWGVQEAGSFIRATAGNHAQTDH